MDEIIEELPTDILEKEYKELTDSEKAKIVLELNRFALSDYWTDLQKSLNEEAILIEKEIEQAVEEREGKQDLLFSQFDRDIQTHGFMQATAKETHEFIEATIKGITNDSIGAKIFKNKLEAGAKNYRKQAMERIEAGYDAPVYTAIDFLKNDRALRLSVKVWLQQTINSYEKVTEAPEVKSAY